MRVYKAPGAGGGAPGTVDGPGGTLEGDELELYNSIRTWRAGVARAEGRGRPFMIVTEAVMRGIATARPTCVASLLAVKGIGPKKAERYGEALLEVVRAHEQDGAGGADAGGGSGGLKAR